MTAAAAPDVLWTPSEERTERATITRYTRWLEATRGLTFPSYQELWQWSVSDLEGFWSSIVECFGVRFDTPPQRVLGSSSMPGAEWFPGSRLSYPEHIFRGKDDGAVAVRHASELRELGEWTWAELRDHTAAIAAGLRSLGVDPGDRVAAYMPNIPETLAAFLATASLGAVWSSAAPEFGVRSVIDRFSQIEPKVLLAVDGYRYGGRDFDKREAVRDIAAGIPSLERVVSFGYLDGSGWTPEFMGEGERLAFEQVAFDHPLWVLYSSGTTGLPKPIVQGHGGILLEQVKKGHLHLDAQADDRVFWFSTTGWMMWNFLVGVLLTDASVVLFDGNPGYPDMSVLWQLAEDAGITTFGTSAAYVSACMKDGVTPRDGRSLSAMSAVGRHRLVHRVRGRGRDPAGVPGGAPGAMPRRVGRGVGSRRPAARRRGGRTGDHQADAVDAAVLLGRRRRLAIPGLILLDVPRDLAARGLDRDHEPGDGDHLRALGLDDQPGRGADGDQRDLSRGAVAG